MAKKRVLIAMPTAWDARQLAICRDEWAGTHAVVHGEPSDEECPDDLDPIAYVERAARERRGDIEGVFSSSDYPGATIAAAIATALGLPGSTPDVVIRCSHKYYSRIAQREAAPEAVPDFAIVDPGSLDAASLAVGYPCFVKPVKGAYSLLARRIGSPSELEAFLARPAVREFGERYMAIFNRLVRRYTDLAHDGRCFIAEAICRGRLVTVEGYALDDGEVALLGIVDSTTDAATGSFVRFDYPSALAAEMKARLFDVARRVIGRLGLRSALWNVEMMADEATGEVRIIEVNPRMCGQFADLYAKVDGTNGYAIALALATGRRPEVRRGSGMYGAAASFPLRVFAPTRVARAPAAEDVRAAERLFPRTRIWVECRAGQGLSDFESSEDGASARYAVVNLGGDDRDDLARRLDAVRSRLGFRLEPL